MKPPKPTIRSIAVAAGVSKSTVARALQGERGVEEQTRRRVRAAAEAQGYRANPLVGKLMAQLRASRTPRYRATLALLNGSTQADLREDPLSHRGRLARGIIERARELGYEVAQFRLRDPEMTGARLKRILRARGIDGAVVVSPREHQRLPAEFAEVWGRFAVVVAGRRVVEPSVSCAANDQYATVMLAVRELQALGRRRIGLAVTDDERLEHRFTAGYWAAHAGRGPRRCPPVLDLKKEPQGLVSWARSHRLDAIITYDQRLPRLLREGGLDPFGRIALAHLDWTPALGDWYGADQRTEELGAVAVDMLVGQIQRHELGPPRVQRFSLIESRWITPPADAALPRSRAP